MIKFNLLIKQNKGLAIVTQKTGILQSPLKSKDMFSFSSWISQKNDG